MSSKFEKRMLQSISRPWAIETEGRPPVPREAIEEPAPAVEEPVEEPDDEELSVTEEPEEDDLDEGDDLDGEDLDAEGFPDDEDAATREVQAMLYNLQFIEED